MVIVSKVIVLSVGMLLGGCLVGVWSLYVKSGKILRSMSELKHKVWNHPVATKGVHCGSGKPETMCSGEPEAIFPGVCRDLDCLCDDGVRECSGRN